MKATARPCDTKNWAASAPQEIRRAAAITAPKQSTAVPEEGKLSRWTRDAAARAKKPRPNIRAPARQRWEASGDKYLDKATNTVRFEETCRSPPRRSWC